MPSPEAQLEQAAKAVYQRYQLEFVEAFNLCPYARQAREAGQVRQAVVQSSDATEEALDAIATWGPDPSVEIGLLLCPRVEMDRVPWERWVSKLISKDAERHPPGRVPFAMAAFHPNASVRFARAESLVPFIRRTPDPTIQLVRVTALERVRKGSDEGTKFIDPSRVDLTTYVPPRQTSLREKICAANARTLEQVGFDRVQALLADIEQQRATTYASLGLPLRQWNVDPGSSPR